MDSNWNDAADRQVLGASPRGSGRLIGLFLLLAVVLIVVVLFKSLTPPSDPSAAPAVGQRYEKLQLEPLTTDAEPITVDSLQGQVVLINFWGPWCGPCISEFPELVELRQGFAEQPRFRFISVSCPQGPNSPQHDTQTQAFLKREGYDLPVHRDANFTSGLNLMELNREAGFSFPTTVLLDESGVIRSLWIGYRPGLVKEMRDRVAELLRK